MKSTKKVEHYHSCWEIYYLLDGICCFFIDNKSYRLTPGDMAFFPPGIIHKTNYETPTFSRLLIYCSSDFIPPSSENILHQSPILTRTDATAEIIGSIFKTIQQEHNQPDIFSEDIIKSKVSELLLLIARENKSVDQVKKNSSVVEMAVQYIRSRYMDPISLGDIASYCFVSREHLSRIFKRETGFNISEYLTIYRLQKAESLLRENSKIKITEVAQRCGFNDSNYFSKSFKKMYNIPPTSIKRKP